MKERHPYKARPIAATHDWLTPPEIIQALGRFDLDPCASLSQPWKTADVQYTVEDDGLVKDWFGRVWMNPPYGNHTASWLKKLSAHGNGIALVFARTETRMFFEHVWPKADALLFLQGRPHFYKPDGTRAAGNSGGPIVLIAYGESNAKALTTCGLKGSFVRVEALKQAA